MIAKRPKLPDNLKPEDCITPEQKLEYSRMMRRRWENIPYDAPPSEILDVDKYPMPDPDKPWSHPAWTDPRALQQKWRKRRPKKL